MAVTILRADNYYENYYDNGADHRAPNRSQDPPDPTPEELSRMSHSERAAVNQLATSECQLARTPMVTVSL